MTEPDNPALPWFRGRMTTDPELRRALVRLNRYIVDLFGPMVADEQAAGTLDESLDADALVELVDLVQDGMNRRNTLGTFVTSPARRSARSSPSPPTPEAGSGQTAPVRTRRSRRTEGAEGNR